MLVEVVAIGFVSNNSHDVPDDWVILVTHDNIVIPATIDKAYPKLGQNSIGLANKVIIVLQFLSYHNTMHKIQVGLYRPICGMRYNVCGPI